MRFLRSILLGTAAAAVVAAAASGRDQDQKVPVEAEEDSRRLLLNDPQTYPCLDPGVGGASSVPVVIDAASSAGPVTVRIPVVSDSAGLCTLVRASKSDGSERAPLARSYAGRDWEASPGPLGSGVAVDCSVSATTASCDLTLPPLGDESLQHYVLESFQHATTAEAEAARFLEQATFGPTRGGIDALTATSNDFASWIEGQMDGLATPASSLREFYRRRTNPKFEYPYKVGAVGPRPCELHSRWRKYAITGHDHLSNRKTKKSKVLTVEQIPGVAGYVWRVDGHFRTVTQDPPVLLDFFSGEVDTKASFVLGGRYKLKTIGGAAWKNNCVGCVLAVDPPSTGPNPYYWGLANPPVSVAGVEGNAAVLPYDVLTLPPLGSAGLAPVDDPDDYPLFQKWWGHGEHALLNTTSLESSGACGAFPDFRRPIPHADPDAPPGIFPAVFGRAQDAASGEEHVFAYDPHLALYENTPERPLPDGGGRLVMDTDDLAAGNQVLCQNAQRSFLNEDSCTLSYLETACAPDTLPDPVIVLDEPALLGIRGLTNRLLYALTDLPITDEVDASTGLAYLDAPCGSTKNGARTSRWIRDKSDPTCPNSAGLGPATVRLFRDLLDARENDGGGVVHNPSVADVTRSLRACDAADSSKLSLGRVTTSDGSCWRHVHPLEMSVFDLTSFEALHGGGAAALRQYADGGTAAVPFPGDAAHSPPNQKFYEGIVKMGYPVIGKLGDHVLLDGAEPYPLNDPSVQAAYKTLSYNPSGGPVLICGSPGEVASEPFHGDRGFDVVVPEGTGYRAWSIWQFSAQRHTTWTHLALHAADQLRHKVAWSLSQIVAVGLPGSGMVFYEPTEPYLVFYDIFVRGAFGNYRDMMKEFSFSVIMASWLSFVDNKSLQYNKDVEGIENLPDENYAREIMQLFSIGLFQLNMDGSKVLLDNGKPAETYTIDDIVSYSRAWTGFVRPPIRGGVVGAGRQWVDQPMDPLQIDSNYRDLFPKTDLSGGYIGDRMAPLCADLPSKHFLRKGAIYKLLGKRVSPELQADAGDWEENPELNRVELDPSSLLFAKLCAPGADGACTFPSKIVLDENLAYDAAAQQGPEYAVDTIRTVKLKSGLPSPIHYEYIRQPCVEHAFYNNAKKVIKGQIWSSYVTDPSMCADPRLEAATPMCCGAGWETSFQWGQILCRYQGERVTYNSAIDICMANGLEQCNPWRAKEVIGGACNLGMKHTHFRSWANTGCRVRVKVSLESGQIAITHDPDPDYANQAAVEPLVDPNTMNFFKAPWSGGAHPLLNDCLAIASCYVHDEDYCICDTDVVETAYYTAAANIPSIDALMSSLHIGAVDPATFDIGTYANIGDCGIPEVAVYSRGGDCSNLGADTIFAFEWNSKSMFLKNSQSMVSIIESSFSFRNPVHFISLADPEARDMYHETEAVLDSYFYHPSHPPFMAVRMIQRFGISNPSPRFIEHVSNAYKSGSYQGRFGSGKYGDIGAMVAAILLDQETREVVLDADQVHGHIREPLIKVLSVFRSMGLHYESPLHVPTLLDMNGMIGQGSFESPSVFSFFLPEFTPTGVVQTAGLVAPEAMVLQGDNVLGLLDSFFSTVKFGINKCYKTPNFSGWRIKYPLECTTTEGDTSLSPARFSYWPASTASLDDILDELSLLLTSSRLGARNRALIKAIVDPEFSSGNVAKAVRMVQQLILATPEFHATGIARKQDNPREITGYATTPAEPYKAVVVLMMVGGADSFNLLVPKGGCATLDQYLEYQEARGTHALPKSNLTSISAVGSGQDCTEFGINSHFKILADLYNNDEALFFANTGILTKPMDKHVDWVKESQFQLFAHNTMQHEFYTGDPLEENAGTGVFGRILDVLKEQGYHTSANSVGAGATMLTGDQLYNNPVYSVSTKPPQALNQYPTVENIFDVVKELNGVGEMGNNFLGETWSSTVAKALFEQEQMEQIASMAEYTIANYTVDPNVPLTSNFKAVAQYMKSREFRKVNREVFIVPHYGYDLHFADALSELFIQANAALDNFINEIKSQGLWQNTLIVMGSDFGRSLNANSNGGTDHAWAGNYFLTGGSVKGGKILGEYPQPLSPDHSNWIGRGRFIPTTPWESVWNGVAQWLGIRGDNSLNWALPNRDNFLKCDLFTDEDLFIDGQVSHSSCFESDGDGDGIADSVDVCPDTPYYALNMVDSYGCSDDTATMAPTSTPTKVPTKPPTLDPVVAVIPEAEGYQLVYSLDIPTTPKYESGPPLYSDDNHLQISSFSRVAYYLELDDDYVWVSMDTFTDDASKIGVPCLSPGCGGGGQTVIQQVVTNVNVMSNVDGLSGSGLVGNVEFWPFHYSQGNAISIPGASEETLDFGDTASSSGFYGSMQVHINSGGSYSGTVFAFNRFNDGTVADLGIGDQPSGSPDWTFSKNANTFTIRKLKVYVLDATITSTVAPTKAPTTHQTLAPISVAPTKVPNTSPTDSPTKSPADSLTIHPTMGPTKSPTAPPTDSPTKSPADSLTIPPTMAPTKSPTAPPTVSPTKSPADSLTVPPTMAPTKSPTAPPTGSPTKSPADSLTVPPTMAPTKSPTAPPTGSPTKSPADSPAINICDSNLLQNGDMEDIGTSWRGWYASINQTNGVTGSAIQAYDRDSWRSGIRQDLSWDDFGCLSTGTVVHIDFKAKLLDGTTGEGLACEPSSITDDCPMITFRHEFPSDEIVNWDYVRDPSMSWDPSGWNDFHGVYVVTKDWASLTGTETGYWWYIMISGGPPGSVIVADDITMTVGHTLAPSNPPTNFPTTAPTLSPSTAQPTKVPTPLPTILPTDAPSDPLPADGTPVASVLGIGSTISNFGCVNTHMNANAIDGTTNKYYCDRTGQHAVQTGIVVSPSHQQMSIVKSIRVYAHNNCPNCDPVSFVVEGRTSATSAWVEIAQGDLPWNLVSNPTRNGQGVTIVSTYESGDASRSYTEAPFSNIVAYAEYRLTFPETRLSGSNSFQFGEVELPGFLLPLPPTLAPTHAPTDPPVSGESVTSVLGIGSTISNFGCVNTHMNARAIDGTTNKYYCDRTGQHAVQTGIVVSPSHQQMSIVKSIRVYAHNNCPNCDPVSFVVEGRTSATSAWVAIAQGDLPWNLVSNPTRNGQGVTIVSTYESGDASRSYTEAPFSNTVAYAEYRLTFPETRLSGSNSFMFGEVELPGFLL